MPKLRIVTREVIAMVDDVRALRVNEQSNDDNKLALRGKERGRYCCWSVDISLKRFFLVKLFFVTVCECSFLLCR